LYFGEDGFIMWSREALFKFKKELKEQNVQCFHSHSIDILKTLTSFFAPKKEVSLVKCLKLICPAFRK
jgi:hypothetical protein